MNISAKYELPRIIRKGVPDFPPHVKQNLLSNFAQWPLSAHYQYEPCTSRDSGFWRKIGQKWGKSGQAKNPFNVWQYFFSSNVKKHAENIHAKFQNDIFKTLAVVQVRSLQ